MSAPQRKSSTAYCEVAQRGATYAPSNYWEFGGDRESLMQRIHAYPAKFSAFITPKAFAYAQQRGVTVNRTADIFCGCGTTALEAKHLGTAFWGGDINPVATLIARVKSEDYQPARLQNHAARVLRSFGRRRSPRHRRQQDDERLLLLSAPKQIGLPRIKQLLQTCHTSQQVALWIDTVAEENLHLGPVRETLESIYEHQLKDTEAPEIASVRIKLNEKTGTPLSRLEVKNLIESIRAFVPGFISIDGERICIQVRPAKILDVIYGAINRVPPAFHLLYLDAFAQQSKKRP